MTSTVLQIEAELAALLGNGATTQPSPAAAYETSDILSAQVIALAREAGRG